MTVRAKKNLGQHFLKDEQLARNIVSNLNPAISQILEIGPGMGVLTRHLLARREYETTVVEIDRESIDYLKEHYPDLDKRIIEGDFLKTDLKKIYSGNSFAIIGNFPYNISSQIFFKILDAVDLVPEIICMLQEEVAQRIYSGPGSKVYGILSVLLQAWYNVEYIYSVPPEVFNPPPKVNSAVIRLSRNEFTDLGCNENLFRRIVKATFNQRRKMLRNSLRSMISDLGEIDADVLTRRPEQLSVRDFINLTNQIEPLIIRQRKT